MPPKMRKSTPAKPTKKRAQSLKNSSTGRERSLKDEVEAVLASLTLDKRRGSAAMNANAFVVCQGLKRLGSKRIRDDMGPRYGIHTDKAFGVGMAAMQKLAKSVKVNTRGDMEAMRRNHELALALWDTGWYEARTVAALVDEPELVTSVQMDRWAKDFDNWGICDTVCFKLLDQSPHAWGKVAKWSNKRDEFVKRAAFALLASLALHDKNANDDRFAQCLPLIERAASDERNLVKKGVSWALRAVGRRSAALNAAAVTLARRLSASPEAAARWVGKDALRELTSPAVTRRLAARRRDAEG